MKGIILALIIFLSIDIFAVEEKGGVNKKIRLSAFHYPPYMDESLENKGLFCELILKAYELVGIEVEFDFYPLRRSTKYVIEGRSLAQLGTIWNFPESVRSDLYPVPSFYYKILGFYLKTNYENIEFNNLEDLNKYRISTILGSSDEKLLKESGLLMINSVSTMEQLFKQVYLGRSDIAFAVKLSGIDTLKRYYLEDIEKWKITENYLQKIDAHVVFSKKYPNYLSYVEKLKKGLYLLKEKGKFYNIFQKYNVIYNEYDKKGF